MNDSEQALRNSSDVEQPPIESVEPEQPTYSVSTWDHEIEDWHTRELRATKWDLRRWLRKLYAESWDHVSILIQRND